MLVQRTHPCSSKLNPPGWASERTGRNLRAKSLGDGTKGLAHSPPGPFRHPEADAQVGPFSASKGGSAARALSRLSSLKSYGTEKRPPAGFSLFAGAAFFARQALIASMHYSVAFPSSEPVGALAGFELPPFRFEPVGALAGFEPSCPASALADFSFSSWGIWFWFSGLLACRRR